MTARPFIASSRGRIIAASVGLCAALALAAGCQGEDIDKLPGGGPGGTPGGTPSSSATVTPSPTVTPQPTRSPEEIFTDALLGHWFVIGGGEPALSLELRAVVESADCRTLELVLNPFGPGRCEENRSFEVLGSELLRTTVRFSDCGGEPGDAQVHDPVRVIAGSPRQLELNLFGQRVRLMSGRAPTPKGLRAELLTFDRSAAAGLVPISDDSCYRWAPLLRFARERVPFPEQHDEVIGASDAALQGNELYGTRDLPGFEASEVFATDDFVVRWTGTINLPPGTVRFTSATADDAIAVFLGEDAGVAAIERAAFTTRRPQGGAVEVCNVPRREPLNVPGGPTAVEIIYAEFGGSVSLNLQLELGGNAPVELFDLTDSLTPELPAPGGE